MRRLYFALMIATSVTPFSALAEDIKTGSKITAATVYSDRATLTRNAEVSIPAGKHNLVFTGIPISMFPDTLRTKGKAVAKVTFGALTHKMESHEDYVVPKEKELNDKLLLLQDQRAILEAEKQALDAGKTFLENLGKQANLRANEDIAEIDLKPEVWASAADSLQAKISENLKASLAQGVAIRKTDEEIRKVYDELGQLRTGQKQTYSVVIPFESAAATTLNIDLSYQLPSVSWQPVYDARLDVKSGKMELVQYGQVWQQTGEDWTDVALTLSTAQPSQGVGLPELYTHWINIISYEADRAAAYGGSAGNFATVASNMSGAPAARPMLMKSMEVAQDSAVAEEMAMAPPAPQEAGFAAAQINTQGFVGEYKIVGLSTVKSDGTQSKLLIGAFETENAAQVQIKPQMSAEAFLVIKSKLKGESPILPGQVNLFRDEAFIGQSYLPMLRPEDVQELSFGVDNNVVVKRNILKDERSEAGLISKDSVLERNFTTEIHNLHKNPIDIAILETIPVSQDQRIRVEILADKTTPGYEEDLHDVKGVTRWLQTLPPSEKTKVNLGWRVSWPKDQQISGL